MPRLFLALGRLPGLKLERGGKVELAVLLLLLLFAALLQLQRGAGQEVREPVAARLLFRGFIGGRRRELFLAVGEGGGGAGDNGLVGGEGGLGGGEGDLGGGEGDL